MRGRGILTVASHPLHSRLNDLLIIRRDCIFRLRRRIGGGMVTSS